LSIRVYNEGKRKQRKIGGNKQGKKKCKTKYGVRKKKPRKKTNKPSKETEKQTMVLRLTERQWLVTLTL